LFFFVFYTYFQPPIRRNQGGYTVIHRCKQQCFIKTWLANPALIVQIESNITCSLRSFFRLKQSNIHTHRYFIWQLIVDITNSNYWHHKII